MTLDVVLLLLQLVTLSAVVAYFALVLRKLTRVDLKVWRMSEEIPEHIRQVFRQAEALHAVYFQLRFQHPLAPTRDWAASPDALRVLTHHALQAKPITIVECGSGVSTVVLARCAQLNGKGHVFSLDHDLEFAGRTRAALEEQGLQDWATVLHAPLESHTLRGRSWSWYRLSDSIPDEIDLLFIDGPPTTTGDVARYPAGPLLLRRLSVDGAGFLDDASRPEEKRAIEMWRLDLPNLDVVTLDCEKGLAKVHRSKPNFLADEIVVGGLRTAD